MSPRQMTNRSKGRHLGVAHARGTAGAGIANVSTTRVYDHCMTQPEGSPVFKLSADLWLAAVVRSDQGPAGDGGSSERVGQ